MSEHDFIEFDELPKLPLKQREPFLVLDRGVISVDEGGLVALTQMGRTQIPVGAIACLLLEPGVSITHDAVKVCGKTQTLIQWVSEGGTRLYSTGLPGQGPGPNKERQVACWADPDRRRSMARQMYKMRFGEEPGADKDLDQLRGMEGIRVRALYQVLARQAGVTWFGRRYDRTAFDEGDAPNRALTAANQCLYGASEAAIWTAGYDPTLGFLHSGSQTAFAQDVADLYKFEFAVPIAFAEAAHGDADLTNRIRRASRDAFRRKGLLDRIIKDLDRLFEAA